MKFWLMKSEPSVYSIEDLKRDGFSAWEGVRNFQARNFMRDDMRDRDMVIFYHSNAKPPGAAGLCRVCREAFPDHTALDNTSDYFDPKASEDNPRWMMVEVEFVEQFTHLVTLEEMKKTKGLEGLVILKKGSRLSITPLTHHEYEIIRRLGRKDDDSK
jgi:predicted RNA-binding protein with PUA-like domain